MRFFRGRFRCEGNRELARSMLFALKRWIADGVMTKTCAPWIFDSLPISRQEIAVAD